MTIAWVFPGQGSQVVGMGRDLYAQIPAAREVFDEADAVLDVNIARLCFEGPEDDLTATENTQPALLAVSVAILRGLNSLLPEGHKIVPQVVAGHSLGEYSALVAAKALDLATALRLVRRRGELMAEASEGTMAAVIGLNEQILEQVCHEVLEQRGEPVVIANYNAPGQLVISGAIEAVGHACKLAKERGAKRAMPLKVRGAFHSPLMTRASEGMAKVLAAATIADMCVPLIANVTAAPLLHAEDVRRELVSQVVSPVQWIASVQRMVSQGISTFVEIGPGSVLTGLIKRISSGVQVVNLRNIDDVHAFVAAGIC
ncbi:MAG: ACP S-malonyltransferase [Chloroflexaceae bacterium]|nr:ACP S-malonyltransferase [Chloroflexaceae bacterium]